MSKYKIVLNSEGVRDLLRSEEMMAEVSRHAEETLAALGEGYEVSTYTGKNRVNASVIAVSGEAIKENLENNTILKALR